MGIRSLVGDRAFYRRLFTVMLPILVQNIITNFVNLLDNRSQPHGHRPHIPEHPPV